MKIDIIVLIVLIGTLIYCYDKYRKGNKRAFYYTRGFVIFVIYQIVSMSKYFIAPRAALDNLHTIVCIALLLLGAYNVFYLTRRGKRVLEQ